MLFLLPKILKTLEISLKSLNTSGIVPGHILLHIFCGYRECHHDGTVEPILKSNFSSLYKLDVTCRVFLICTIETASPRILHTNAISAKLIENVEASSFRYQNLLKDYVHYEFFRDHHHKNFCQSISFSSLLKEINHHFPENSNRCQTLASWRISKTRCLRGNQSCYQIHLIQWRLV
ncbi:hypothetical protein Avbf_02939 [Armadillidium vulgare]|nr:hypothetical protein Avbf_02939 [Armadillidium vulgare]